MPSMRRWPLIAVGGDPDGRWVEEPTVRTPRWSLPPRNPNAKVLLAGEEGFSGFRCAETDGGPDGRGGRTSRTVRVQLEVGAHVPE